MPGQTRKKKTAGAQTAGVQTAGAQTTCMGTDTEGGKYKTAGDLWRSELKDEQSRRGWYGVAEKYWDGQEANLNGVLGGYPETNGPDLRESKRFLDLLRLDGPLPTKSSSAGSTGGGLSVLDAGAGIGRVTSGLLLDMFD